MKDTDIIELYNKRDETAIKETETKYGRLLNKIAYEILDSSEDSEECVNTTYLKTWNAIPPTVPQSLRAFICRIVRNTALSLLQKLGKRKKEDIYYELQDVIMDDNTTEMKAEAKELTTLINGFLALQKKRNRQLFVLRYYFLCFLNKLQVARIFSSLPVRIHLLCHSIVNCDRECISSAVETFANQFGIDVAGNDVDFLTKNSLYKTADSIVRDLDFSSIRDIHGNQC